VDVAFGADVEQIAALDVSLHRPHHHDVVGLDVGNNLTESANRHPVIGKVD
jgi:hypothetical protein